MSMNQKDLDACYMEIAGCVQKMSTSPGTKVGAVIVVNDGSLAIGYNSFPRGVQETEERWSDEEKYKYVVCAVMNAVLSIKSKDIEGSTIYVSSVPCSICAQLIIQSGVKRVVYRNPEVISTKLLEESNFALPILQEAGIEVEKFNI